MISPALRGMHRLSCIAIISLLAAGSDVAAQNAARDSEALTRPYLKAQQLVVVEGRRRLNLYCIGQLGPLS
jgi:hypothetical protein